MSNSADKVQAWLDAQLELGVPVEVATGLFLETHWGVSNTPSTRAALWFWVTTNRSQGPTVAFSGVVNRLGSDGAAEMLEGRQEAAVPVCGATDASWVHDPEVSDEDRTSEPPGHGWSIPTCNLPPHEDRWHAWMVDGELYAGWGGDARRTARRRLGLPA